MSGVLSAQLKDLMMAVGCKQKGLAEIMGVSVDRVKNLTRGRAGNLTREEGEALIRKLNVRAEWLATGEGPMFRSDGEQELERRLDAVANATQKARLTGLDTEAQTRVQMLLTGLEIGNTDLVMEALNVLSADEQQLVAHYRQSTPEGKKALRSTASVFAKSGVSTEGDARKETSISVSGSGNRVAGKDYHEK
ncbi:hypothetical protein BFW38_06355 [Terasakiispira papahanaumokuakeensis]|uniref:HTH cro/C1-type domain-containing protein n=1 Tax=Terasakiispira papahanaumokuakeensis TaxID=197479 RepID=A0A1E2V881_9GAMM|nr:helix-turn-helix transcriptional regulator [Terasakiispira papahanaumokuakeensis]ODC03220.1 hypothetical protein BFW38_06355 [Terasakiispira papahanaumokuakeensis]